jgi:hypothetical protein
MSIRLLTIYLVICCANIFGLSQTTGKQAEAEKELREKAVALLKETARQSAGSASMNRAGFMASAGGLLWNYDQKEAKSAYGNAMNDIRAVLARLDAAYAEDDREIAEIKAARAEAKAEANTETSAAREVAIYAANAAANAVNGPIYDHDEHTPENYQLRRRAQNLAMLRNSLLISLAQQDPVAAYDFFMEIMGSVGNFRLKKVIEQNSESIQRTLAGYLAGKDPAKALELARKELSDGLKGDLVGMLGNIYEKDDAAGAAFAGELLGKINSSGISFQDDSLMVALQLLGYADQNAESITRDKLDKKAITILSERRALAEKIAQFALTLPPSLAGYGGDSFWKLDQISSKLSLIDKYAPSRAAQLRRALRSRGRANPYAANAAANAYPADYDGGEPDDDVPPAVGTASSVSSGKDASKDERDDLPPVAPPKLTDEQKQKMLAQARREVAQTRGPQEKMAKWVQFAVMAYTQGEKETAKQFLTEAETLAPTSMRSSRDAMAAFMFASAYAKIEPARAFTLLEDIVFRLNGLLGGFIQIMEFIAEDDVYEDGEINSNMFSMLLGRQMGGMDELLRDLARSDFERTRGLIEKFDRSEVQLTLKLVLAEALLKKEGLPGEGAPTARPAGSLP